MPKHHKNDVVEATATYEAWVRTQTVVIESDLRLKHRLMRSGRFPFLRGTFYRWAQLWPAACPELAAAPEVLAVGDLHLENFGTWRDSQGRLVWGLNDFDEAYPLAYTNDLVRLAASALLAIKDEKLTIGAEAACRAVLDGYVSVIRGDGLPFVLEEHHPGLRAMALSEARDPAEFWRNLTRAKDADPPPLVRRLIRDQMPRSPTPVRFVHRVAGMGSLGRQRYVGITHCEGAFVAREAKALLPSACAWLANTKNPKSHSAAAVRIAVRDRDPFFQIKKGWVVRRLAPDCSRIQLADFRRNRDERDLLMAMGGETANLHLGSRSSVAAVRRDLRKRRQHWLHEAAAKMADITLNDWDVWRAPTT